MTTEGFKIATLLELQVRRKGRFQKEYLTLDGSLYKNEDEAYIRSKKYIAKLIRRRFDGEYIFTVHDAYNTLKLCTQFKVGDRFIKFLRSNSLVFGDGESKEPVRYVINNVLKHADSINYYNAILSVTHETRNKIKTSSLFRQLTNDEKIILLRDYLSRRRIIHIPSGKSATTVNPTEIELNTEHPQSIILGYDIGKIYGHLHQYLISKLITIGEFVSALEDLKISKSLVIDLNIRDLQLWQHQTIENDKLNKELFFFDEQTISQLLNTKSTSFFNFQKTQTQINVERSVREALNLHNYEHSEVSRSTSLVPVSNSYIVTAKSKNDMRISLSVKACSEEHAIESVEKYLEDMNYQVHRFKVKEIKETPSIVSIKQ